MYDWKRFWCPGDASFSLADDGFLYDPDAKYGNHLNPRVVPFSQLHGAACLVLLGEPGIGKSTAVEQEVAAAKAEFRASANVVVAINLGEYGDETRLVHDVFGSQEMAGWRTGSHGLHLFLDSLDECGLQIPHVAKILRRQIGDLKQHLSRLRLRIACRTADWPSSLTDSLAALWDERPAIFELVPLRRRDVATAAIDEGIDADAFIEAVIRAGAQPLAIKPVTLNFLLRIYKDRGGFPSTQSELYVEGCQRLCAEMNQDRQSARQSGSLSPEQRLAVAERIAAVMTFCNVGSAFLGVNASDAPNDSVVLADLVGGTETVAGTQFEVGVEQIKEVLGTGLFSGRGRNRLGFAHQTYAEFLAACYFVDRGIPFEQRMKLLRNADDSTGKIVPQLGETAAWLADMDTETFEEILRCDPQILMRSDVAKADDTVRKVLVQKLLDLSKADEMTGRPFDDASHYHKLNHEGLSKQLEPFIRDTSNGITVRRFAIGVAQECGRKDLQSLLADIAVDPAENYRVRITAAYAVAAIGDDATRLRLKPLALKTSVGDDDFTIKAVALRTLWPSQITTDELFDTLEIPQTDTYGTYRLFLRRELPQRLTAERLPCALMWAARLSEAEMHEHAVSDLISEISLRGWIHFDEPAVRAAMAVFAVARLRCHLDIVPTDDERFVDDEGKRHALGEMIVLTMSDFESHGTGLVYLTPRLVQSSDVLWMLEKAIAETDTRVAERWVALVERLFNSSIPGQLDALIAARARSPAVDACFKPMLSEMRVDSEESAELKKRHYEHVAHMREMEVRQNPPPLDPPPEARIEAALVACEAGNPDGWFSASRELQLESNSTHYLQELEDDLTTLPGWLSASPETRSRLIVGTKLYLTKRSAGDDWLGTNSTPFAALAGYKALLLLQKESRSVFESLAPDVWARWAPIVVSRYGAESPDEDQVPHDDIARHCAAQAPHAVSACITQIVSQRRAEDGLFVLPRFVQLAWNDRIRQTLLVAVTNPAVHPQVAGCLLESLLEHGCSDAKMAAKRLLTVPIPVSGDGRDRAEMAAKALLRHADDAGWDVVWPAIQNDAAFGHTVLEAVAAKDMHNPTIVSRLSENDAAALFVWLAREYPHATDPKHDPRDAIAAYRDTILQALQHRGTKEAVAALQLVADELSHLAWMRWVIADARSVALRVSWRPLAPRELIRLAHTPKIRLVQSAAHLQDLILESLSELQRLLQGETPASPDLWDRVKPGKYVPKDENHLSDYIKRHLEQDLTARGIVALREVEIRRGEGEGKGEQTDIHVTGFVPGITEGNIEQVRVIIESKGMWHAEVDTAMQSQLVDRYLKDNPCQHGIYLVGWYRCTQWDPDSPSYKKSRKESFDSAKGRFEEQAASLSNESRAIKALVLNAALR